MSDSPFNIESLVSTPLAPLSTVVLLIDDGDYKAIVADAPNGVKEWFYAIDIKNGARAGQTALKVRVPFLILDDAAKAKTGRDRNVVSLDLFVDIDATSGQISSKDGDNVTLGRLFKTLGMNEGGSTISMLPGKGPLMVRVKTRTDEKDVDKKYAEVKTFAPI